MFEAREWCWLQNVTNSKFCVICILSQEKILKFTETNWPSGTLHTFYFILATLWVWWFHFILEWKKLKLRLVKKLDWRRRTKLALTKGVWLHGPLSLVLHACALQIQQSEAQTMNGPVSPNTLPYVPERSSVPLMSLLSGCF